MLLLILKDELGYNILWDKEIIGKEAYNNIDYTLDGVFYTDVAGNRINLNDIKNPDLRNKGAIDGLYKNLISSFDLGKEGIRLKPGGTNSRILLKNINDLINNPKAAADLFISGVPGYEMEMDSNPAYQYILQRYKKIKVDGFAKRYPFKDIPEVVPGMLDDESDEYKQAVEELKSNVPINWLKNFLLDMTKDANDDGFSQYKPPKNTSSIGEGINMMPTINAINAGAKIIPLPSTFGTGIVASQKKDGKYYISSGARASQMFDPESGEVGYTLEELGKVLGLKISGTKSDPMDTNNDGVISDEEFNRAMGGDGSSSIFPTLQLPTKDD